MILAMHQFPDADSGPENDDAGARPGLRARAGAERRYDGVG
jgi:hypothetical protein